MLFLDILEAVVIIILAISFYNLRKSFLKHVAKLKKTLDVVNNLISIDGSVLN